MNTNTATPSNTQITQINLLVFSKTKTLKPTVETYSFSPNQTTTQEILDHFKNKVSVAFSENWVSFEAEVVKFTHLPPAYIMTPEDAKRTLLVFKKCEETIRKQELIVERIFKPTQESFQERQLNRFELPFNTTSGHLFYFLQQYFYPQQQDLHEKLIFLRNSNYGEYKLWNLSHYIFPKTNAVAIFESVKTSSFASSFVSIPPQPACEGKPQITIRYCFDPSQQNCPDSVVFRSSLSSSDTCLSVILHRFKQEMYKDLFLTYHNNNVVYNGSQITPQRRTDTINPSTQNHEIILFADNFCYKCSKTIATVGSFFICKKCHYNCSYPDCKSNQDYRCTKCNEFFCRDHLQWCNNNNCFKPACFVCLRQPENVFCEHSFQQKKGYKVDYKLWHQSERLSPISSGHLNNIESVKHFLDQIPLLPQYQKYDYIVLDGKDKSKIYFTKESKLFSTCIEELIHYNTPSKLRVQLKQGKHWCECSSECEERKVCGECGLEKLIKLQTFELGSDASFSVFIPQYSKVLFSGHAYYETTLFQVLQEITKELVDHGLEKEFKCYHSCTVKQGKKSVNICFDSYQIFKPIFSMSKKFQTYATLTLYEKKSCPCSTSANLFELKSGITSNCKKCGYSYNLYQLPEENDLCSRCSTQQPHSILGAHLFQFSKIIQSPIYENYFKYLGKANKSINTHSNVRRATKKRKVEIFIPLEYKEFDDRIKPFLFQCKNLLTEGQMLLFKCHMCNGDLLNHIKLSPPLECSQCHFLFCLGCKSSESCSLCTENFLSFPEATKIQNNIQAIKAFCKKAEKFSLEFEKFCEPNFS